MRSAIGVLSRLRPRVLWVVLACGPMAPIMGQADASRITGRPAPTPGDFTVSAKDWAAPSRLGFKQNDTIRIVVADLNPFASTYRLELKGTAVAEASPAAFFNAVFGLSLPVTVRALDLSSKSLAMSAMSDAIMKATGGTCTGPASAEYLERAVQMAALLTTRAGIDAAAKGLAGALAQPNSAFNEALMRARDGHDAQQINKAATSARAHGRVVVETYQEAHQRIRPLVQSWVDNMRREGERSELAVVRHPQCADLRALRFEFLGLVPDTLQLKDYLATITARRTEMAQTVAAIDGIVDRAEKYYLTLSVPSYRQPADVEVFVSTQPLKMNLTPATTGNGDQTKPVKFDTVARYTFNVGGRGRLSMSAGVVWGDLPDRTYGVVQRSMTGLDGSSTTASFVDLTKNSSGRIVPMLFLNTNLCGKCGARPGAPSVHAVLGVTPKALSVTRFDYFVGAALGFFGDRLYANGGLFIAPFDRLNGGLARGDQLPTGQTSVSTRSVLAARPGIAVSYRVAPW